MKKTFAILLCLAALVLMAVAVLAAEPLAVTVKADKTAATFGEEILFTVSVPELAACKSGGIQIRFDQDAFERTGSKWLLENTTMASASGDGVFAYADAQAVSGGVFQFALKVKAQGASTQEISVTLTLRDASGSTVSGQKTVSVTLSCQHSYDNTCDGECNLCGEKRAVEHTWNEGKVTQNATCMAEGTKTFTCTVCGQIKNEPVPIAEHTYSDDCDTTCDICGKERIVTHSWDSGKVTQKPTCTAEGEKTFTCTLCKKTKTEPVAATGHAYSNGCDTTCNNGCGTTREPNHSFDTKWSSDEKSHWHSCTVCGEKKDTADHIPGEPAGEYTDQTCTACGYVIQAALGHTHNYSEDWTTDANGHSHACIGCGGFTGYQNHTYENDCDATCDVCGYARNVSHSYEGRWSSDEKGHWHQCGLCGQKLEVLPHTPGPKATEDTAQYCTDCGFEIAPALGHTHSYEEGWQQDEDGHWQVCICGESSEKQPHSWDEGLVTKEPTETEAGSILYLCTDCGREKTEELPVLVPETSETDPNLTTAPTEPGEDEGKPFPWKLAVVLACAVLSAGGLFLVIGIAIGKKRSGKFTEQ